MPSSLNSSVSARDNGTNSVQYLRKRITYLNRGTAITVGKLPPGSIVVGGGFQIVTAFNGSGTDTVDIGTTDDADAFATIMDVSASGTYLALDELATTNDYSDTAEVTVTVTYNDQNSNSTAGEGVVVIMFVTKNPAA